MDKKMKISVVMATYNGEKYLTDQLVSIYEQTRPADEVLFFDDGSVDRTPELIQSFICDHQLQDSWIFEVNSTNKGCIKNFLDGACKATGDIIFYSDQDDVWDKRKIEMMEKGFINHPDMQACYCLRHFIDKEGNEIPMRFDFMTNVMVRTTGFQKVSISEAVKYNKSPGLCLAIKKNLILETKDMILKNGLTHDLPIGTVASIYDGYYVLNKKLVFYRQHSNNVSEARFDVKSRLTRLDKQISGRQGRLNQMQAIIENYNDALSYEERDYLSKAIISTSESIENLKNKNLKKLFLAIFDRNPMMNNWIAINNFLICLRGKLVNE